MHCAPQAAICSDLHKHRLLHYFMNYKCCAVLCVYCPTEQCLLFFSLWCFLLFAIALFCILSAILCVTLRYAMPGVQRFPIRRQNTPLSRQDTPKTQPEVKLDCWWLFFLHFCTLPYLHFIIDNPNTKNVSGNCSLINKYHTSPKALHHHDKKRPRIFNWFLKILKHKWEELL